MFRTATTIRNLAVAALAAAAVVPATAQAQVWSLSAHECIKDLRGPDYRVHLCGVTDVDQFRTGLPGSTPGNSYCMPTSYFNVLRYFAKEVGVPMTFGIAGIDPANPADYTKTTQALGWISTMSGGSASGSGSYSGELTAWDKFTSYAASKGWAFDRGTHAATANEDFGYELAKRLRHGPVQIGYKRWTMGTPSGGSVWNYSGSGHATTVVGARGTIGGGEVKLLLADPGRAPDHNTGDWLNTQSPYTLEEVTIKRVEIISNGAVPSDGDTTSDRVVGYKKSFQWELTGPNYKTWQVEGTTRAIIHSYNWFAAVQPSG